MKKTKLFILVSFLILFMFSSISYILAEIDWTTYGIIPTKTLSNGLKLLEGKPATYFGTTGKTIKAHWDEITYAGCDIGYEVELFHVEQESIKKFGILQQTTLEFQLPRSGHFILRVRTICIDNPNMTSDWAISTDSQYARIDGNPNGWWLYGYVEKPGLIEFNF